ncbi:hypothetical protein FAS41_27885 [Pseudomonas nicosulfuronedens]|uniref:Uncharacterized protein n=1 Tax=Pseudomonas nicosulfuronedens TaxID=2571105 RepID=A0A5R9QLS4_9PSED|nr:hypothetical protein [Pseudomonas nicosulfuronedens]TLX70489.1 hypothetical protein FAS41_27885 [Pseudomonas nicosulfuronedens]
MEIIALIVVVAAGLFIFAMSRGKKAVRAYIYLAARSEGASVEEANELASRIDTHRAGQLNTAMRQFILQCYNGQQLPMISDARLDGFKQ